MKGWVATILGLALALSVAAAADAATEERRIALVIGNARYPDAPLRNPVNDARAMAKALTERGFEVLLRENTTKQQLEAAVADFGEKLNDRSTGLFFYAGHGMQVNGRNYIVPVDARITAEARVRLETLDVDTVLEQMQAARSKVNVVILDACRNNPFERRFRSFGGGLAQINAPEGTLIAYATAPGKVAADGSGANGLYTSELLKALRVPGLKVEDVFKQVRINVSRASDGNQTPWEASSLVGDFFFVPPPAPPPVVEAPRPSEEAIELAFWDSIKTSSIPAEVQAYLDQYPDGRFTRLARTRLAALQSPARPAAPPAGSRPTFDGLYEAKIRNPTYTTRELAAQLTIEGRRITGHALRDDQARRCRLSGTLGDDGALSGPIRIECDEMADRDQRYAAIVLLLEGRFERRADGSGVVGETTYRAADGETRRVTWLSPSAPKPASVTASAAAKAASVTDSAPAPQPAPPPVAVAAAVVAPPRPSGPALNGRYRTVITGATWLYEEIPAEIEIDGTRVTGGAMRKDAPRACPIAGRLAADGTVQSLTIDCDNIADSGAMGLRYPRIAMQLAGRFARGDGGADFQGTTSFRTHEGRTGSLTWRRVPEPPSPAASAKAPAPAPAAVAAAPAAAAPSAGFDGRYSATLRNTHLLSSVELPTTLDINGRVITGSSYLYPDVRRCTVSGTVEADGAARITVGCEPGEFSYATVKSSHTVILTGRFVRSGDGAVTAETSFRSNEGRTGTLTWQRM